MVEKKNLQVTLKINRKIKFNCSCEFIKHISTTKHKVN